MSDPYSSGSSQNNRGQNQGENPWPVYGQTNPGGVQEGQGSTPWPVYGGADASGSQPPQSPQYFPGGQAGAQFPTSSQQTQNPYGASPYGTGPQGGTPYGSGVPQNTPGPHAGGYGYPVSPPLPSRTGPILTIVGGAILMVVIAPIILVAMIFSGIGLSSIVESSMQATNGGVVVVGEPGSIGVATTSTLPQTCTLSQEGLGSVEMQPELDGAIVVARDLTPGEYTLSCTGMTSSDSVVVFDGEALDGMLPATASALGWASVVGIVGLGVLIGGIVWLVKRNGQRRSAMMGYRV